MRVGETGLRIVNKSSCRCKFLVTHRVRVRPNRSFTRIWRFHEVLAVIQSAETILILNIPPPPGEVEPCLGEWEKFLHQSDLRPLVTIALAHYQFEAIHPFLDGNGRVGRLLITLFLIERQILPTPLLYLSAFFEASRRDYYDGLRGVSERGAQ
jgi:Fic family protein